MPILKRQPKPTQPAALTIAIEQCDRCERPAEQHISQVLRNIGRTHRFLCDRHYAQWEARQAQKKGE